MKKFIFTLLLCLCIPLCTAFAELMPVKDAWLLGSDGVVILREDGRLYAASSIDTQESTLVASGVRDFLPGDNKTHGILYENGRRGIRRNRYCDRGAGAKGLRLDERGQ